METIVEEDFRIIYLIKIRVKKSGMEGFLLIQVYIQGFIFFENEEEKIYKIRLPLTDIQECYTEKIDMLKPMIEEKVKKYMVEKMKQKCINVVELSRKLNIPVKHILHCYFINDRIDNIEIVWSGSAIKDFRYVPLRHYVEYKDDFIFLKIQSFKFKKKIY